MGSDLPELCQLTGEHDGNCQILAGGARTSIPLAPLWFRPILVACTSGCILREFANVGALFGVTLLRETLEFSPYLAEAFCPAASWVPRQILPELSEGSSF